MDLDKVSYESFIKAKLTAFMSDKDKKSIKNLYNLVIEKVEMSLIEEVLSKLGNNQQKTASILGINRNTLKNKLVKYKIKFKK